MTKATIRMYVCITVPDTFTFKCIQQKIDLSENCTNIGKISR